jgi:hypothetical protein
MTDLVTAACHDALVMNAMTTIPHPDDVSVRQAAEQMVARYGPALAVEEARGRADALARDGRWPEHSTALRVLTVVEQLAGSSR